MANRLVSASLRAPGIAAEDFLRQAQGHERFYWQHDDYDLSGLRHRGGDHGMG